MNKYRVGRQIRCSANLKDFVDADYEPTSTGRVVFSLWAPGDADASPSVTKTWLAAGGGDAELIRDSLGDWHILYTILAAGDHRYRFQAYSGTVSAANSIEVDERYFTAVA